MRQSKPWRRLDNAAKIFPPTSSNRDTKVFRLVCELKEEVDGALLQRALEETVEEFPLFRSVLKKGLFWYYLEESDLLPRVSEESLPVCAAVYNPDKPGLLYRVSYFGRRINLEVFHALADGTGAVQFLRSMVFAYLTARHGLTERLAENDAARDQKSLDAFYKYYDKQQPVFKEKHYRAYRMRGAKLPEERMGVTEGFLSARSVLEQAHAKDATLSEFLISLLIGAIYDNMAVRERSRPVVITVPVDLRRFFSAKTARNFFGVIQIAHHFQTNGESFEEILANVKETFRRTLTKENLHGVISRYSVIENNPFIKTIPLQIKIPALRLAGFRAEEQDTAAFSNLGRIAMPQEAAKHIRLFDVFLSTKRPQLCLCSFGDTLAVSVSSPLVDTSLQRQFFRRLTERGLVVEVVSNLEQFSDKEAPHASL